MDSTTPEEEKPTEQSAQPAPEQTPDQPAGETTEQTQEQVVQKKKSPEDYLKMVQSWDERYHLKKWLIIGSIAIVLFIFLIIIVQSIIYHASSKLTYSSPTVTLTPQTDHIKKAVQPKTPATKQSTQTLVYGTWTSQSSVIRAIDIASDKATTVATLPLTIKKVSILSNKTLLYIDQTDQNDHGQRISVYDIQQQQIVTNIPADNGFGIDDYVLSPNKRYLAIWEVQFSQTPPQTLQGGESRVYAVDLTRPAIVNQLYDEQVTTTVPIHYPRAILDDGTIFTDQYIPNDPKGGTGWAYGMSIVDSDGTNKQDITSMPNGTYGSQPSLSPDGKFLLFAGYDESNGDGTSVKNGYRQALLTPNTVELLDTKTLQRYKLPNLPDTNTYSAVQWDKQTGNPVISILSPDTKQMGTYTYDLTKLQLTQLPLPSANGTPYGYVSQLTADKTLIGIQSTDAANLGNLGETYAYAYTQFAIMDGSGSLNYLSVDDPFAQYITILPGNYFSGVLGAQTVTNTIPSPEPTMQKTNAGGPELFTFFLKTSLGNLRIQGKNTLSCQNLGDARCSALGFTPNSTEFKMCQDTEKMNNQTANACY